MFALVIDGEYKGQVEKEQVQKALRLAGEEAWKVEIASFHQGQGWQAICPSEFAQAA